MFLLSGRYLHAPDILDLTANHCPSFPPIDGSRELQPATAPRNWMNEGTLDTVDTMIEAFL